MEVVQAAAELVPVMADALGAEAYFHIFQQLHWPPLHEKLHGSQPAGLRAALIGGCQPASLQPSLRAPCWSHGATWLPWHLQLGVRLCSTAEPGSACNWPLHPMTSVVIACLGKALPSAGLRVLDALFRIKNCNCIQSDVSTGVRVGRLLIGGNSGSQNNVVGTLEARIMWVLTAGNLAEAAKHLQGRLQPLCGQLIPIVLRELCDSEAGNRQNAAFCAGLLAQHCPEQVHAQLGQLLQVSKGGGNQCICRSCALACIVCVSTTVVPYAVCAAAAN